MTHKLLRRVGRTPAIAIAGIAAVLVLAGCSQGASSAAQGRPAEDLPSTHIHGVARDSGKVNLATHEGLFVLQPDASWKQVGPVVDWMGFVVTAPGVFYASGHPGAGVDLPQPVGLMKSTDAGATWTTLSRGGQSDFHALAASAKGVMGFDDALRITPDGKTWATGGLTASPRSLAAAPDGSKVLATTEQGVLSSTDEGRTWAPLAGAPLMLMTGWADAKTVVGVTVEGTLAVSVDAGVSWKSGVAKVSEGQAVSASRDKAGVLEILVVTDKAVVQSRDNGATLTNLTT